MFPCTTAHFRPEVQHCGKGGKVMNEWFAVSSMEYFWDELVPKAREYWTKHKSGVRTTTL